MPVYVGNDLIDNLFLGSEGIASVWVGSDKVWPPAALDVTLTTNVSSVFSGDTITLTATGIEGLPPYTNYQFQRNTGAGWSTIQNGASNTCNTVVTSDNSQYRVIITDTAADTDTSNTVTITVKATTVSLSANQTNVVEGDSIAFTATGVGEPSITYDFQEKKSGGSWTSFQNTTSNTASRVIADTSFDNAEYRCVITDGLSNGATSNTVGPITVEALVQPGDAEFTTPGDHFWTVPSGVTSIDVEIVGGGGGGGGGAKQSGGEGVAGQSRIVAVGGGGGAAGSQYFSTIAVTPGEELRITVASGGAGGAAGPATNWSLNGNAGSAGGTIQEILVPGGPLTTSPAAGGAGFSAGPSGLDGGNGGGRSGYRQDQALPPEQNPSLGETKRSSQAAKTTGSATFVETYDGSPYPAVCTACPGGAGGSSSWGTGGSARGGGSGFSDGYSASGYGSGGGGGGGDLLPGGSLYPNHEYRNSKGGNGTGGYCKISWT